MRFAQLRTADGSRLHLAGDAGWVDVARALGDERLVDLPGLLAVDPTAEVARAAASGPAIADPAPEAFDAAIGPAPRIFCVGRNYVEHRDEFENAPTPWPETFLRLTSSVTGPYDEIPRPAITDALDYEGELAFVIGRGGRHIPREQGLDHIVGFTVANDFSVRDWQKRGLQWTAGKNFDRTLPVGPVLVTRDELDPTDLAIETRVNGRTVQSARTSQFIFDFGTQIEYLSSFTALRPGDVVCTGTPGGVGAARVPPLLLRDGDVVEVEVERIGAVRNVVVDDGLTPATDRWRRIATRRDEAAAD